MNLGHEIPDSDVDWDPRSLQNPRGKLGVDQIEDESQINASIPDSEPSLRVLHTQLPEPIDNKEIDQLDDIHGIESQMVVDDTSIEPRRFSRPGRVDLSAYLEEDQRGHARDLASEASSDDNFDSSEADNQISSDRIDLLSSPLSSPLDLDDPVHKKRRISRQYAMPNFFNGDSDSHEESGSPRYGQPLVVDSDFDDASSSSSDNNSDTGANLAGKNTLYDLWRKRQEARLFPKRVAADLAATHDMAVADNDSLDRDSYPDSLEQFSQPCSLPHMFGQETGLLSPSREGYASESSAIDYMMSRTRKKRPSSLSVKHLAGHLGGRASNIIRVAARSAARMSQKRGRSIADDPQTKFISGNGHSAQRVLRQWQDGILKLRASNTRAPANSSGRTPGTTHAQSHQHANRNVAIRRVNGSKVNSRPRTRKRSRKLTGQQIFGANVGQNSSRSFGDVAHAQRPNAVQPLLARQYHAPVLERERALPINDLSHFEDANEIRFGPDKYAAEALNHEITRLGIEKARDWLSAPQKVEFCIDTVKASFASNTLAGMAFSTMSPQFQSSPHSQAEIETIVRGDSGEIDFNLYNELYDWLIIQSMTQASLNWERLVSLVCEYQKNDMTKNTCIRLACAVAALIASQGRKPAINRMITQILLFHLSVIALEQNVTEPRGSPGSELARVAAHLGIFKLQGSDLASIIGQSRWEIERRWQYVFLVAAASTSFEDWQSLELLFTQQAFRDGGPEIAMRGYLKLLTKYCWKPSVNVLLSCFGHFIKHRDDPNGELVKLPSMLWRDRFDGHWNYHGARELFLGVLGTSLRTLRLFGDVTACKRIAGRITPLSQYHFPETSVVKVSDMSILSQQYALLLIMIRECPPDAQPLITQIRDLVDLRLAHTFVRAKSLSAWEMLVMVMKYRPDGLIECRNWITSILRDAFTELLDDGKQAIRQVVALAARCTNNVLRRGVSDAVVCPDLLEKIEKCDVLLRLELWKVPLALASSGQTRLLVEFYRSLALTAENEEEVLMWAEVAVRLWIGGYKKEALFCPRERNRSLVYLRLIEVAKLDSQDLVCHGLIVCLKPDRTETDKLYLQAIAFCLHESFSTGGPVELLANSLLTICKTRGWLEAVDEALSSMREIHQSPSDHLTSSDTSRIRRLCFEKFPELRKNHRWLSLSSSHEQIVETIQGYILDTYRGLPVIGMVVFIARRLMRSTEDDRGEQFVSEVCEALAAGEKQAFLNAVDVLFNKILVVFFVTAPSTHSVSECALYVLVRLAHRILQCSDNLTFLTFDFIKYALRFCEFLRLSRPSDFSQAITTKLLLNELFSFGITVTQQLCVAQSNDDGVSKTTIDNGQKIVLGLTDLAAETLRTRLTSLTFERPPDYKECLATSELQQAESDIKGVFRARNIASDTNWLGEHISFEASRECFTRMVALWDYEERLQTIKAETANISGDIQRVFPDYLNEFAWPGTPKATENLRRPHELGFALESDDRLNG